LIGALAVPFTFWLATRFHFEDAFGPSRAQVALLVLLLAVRGGVAAGRGGTLLTEYGPTPWTLLSNGLAIVVIADALRRIHAGAGADLRCRDFGSAMPSCSPAASMPWWC
jgi:hypothetical protein